MQTGFDIASGVSEMSENSQSDQVCAIFTSFFIVLKSLDLLFYFVCFYKKIVISTANHARVEILKR
jgi:hypothetical protein